MFSKLLRGEALWNDQDCAFASRFVCRVPCEDAEDVAETKDRTGEYTKLPLIVAGAALGASCLVLVIIVKKLEIRLQRLNEL